MLEKEIETILNEKFRPRKLLIKNQSHLHKNHKEYTKDSHFSIHIESEMFNNKARIEMHQMIYKALGDLKKSKIHALQIKATTTEEST